MKKCLICKKEFNHHKGKYCSVKCYGISKKGKPTWNTGTKGVMKPNKTSFKKGNPAPKTAFKKGQRASPETEFKKGENLEKNHHNWKGNRVEYGALHDWVKARKGKPQICKHCGVIPNPCKCCGAINKGTRLQWANIDHKYRRNLDDFISLCVSCHKKYDLKNNSNRRIQ